MGLRKKACKVKLCRLISILDFLPDALGVLRLNGSPRLCLLGLHVDACPL